LFKSILLTGGLLTTNITHADEVIYIALYTVHKTENVKFKGDIEGLGDEDFFGIEVFFGIAGF